MNTQVQPHLHTTQQPQVPLPNDQQAHARAPQYHGIGLGTLTKMARALLHGEDRTPYQRPTAHNLNAFLRIDMFSLFEEADTSVEVTPETLQALNEAAKHGTPTMMVMGIGSAQIISISVIKDDMQCTGTRNASTCPACANFQNVAPDWFDEAGKRTQ